MSYEEFYREIVEMKAQLSVLMEWLQKDKEYQRCGWILWKKSEMAYATSKTEAKDECSVKE